MPTITEFYGITGPVPFVDVEVAADNRLYVDPRAIRLGNTPQPFRDEAMQCIDTFTKEVTDSIIRGSAVTRSRGRDLLQRFVEPWETRLGMSAAGFHGHGAGKVVGEWIWDILSQDVEALVRVGVLKQLEDIPLFVEGVDRDITSDITTRLIFQPLAHFTKSVIDTYPQFTASGKMVQTCRKQVWNRISRDWEESSMDLPIVEGKPLLLVPQEWVRRTLLMSATRYYETSVLTFAQLEQAFMTPDGKIIKTPKDRLKEQSGLGRGRGTNLRVTLRAFENGEDLLTAFKAFVTVRLEKTESREQSSA